MRRTATGREIDVARRGRGGHQRRVEPNSLRVVVVTLAELIAMGAVRPVVDRRYPLAEIVEAMGAVGPGLVRGKVLVDIG